MIRIAAKIISLLLPAAILAAAGGAVFFLFATAPKAGRAPGGHAAPIVEVAEVSRTPFQRTVEASGIVMPAREVEIHPEVSGRIIEIHPALQPGGVIPEGAVLVRIDPEEYELALDQAKSALAEAEAALEVEQGRQLVAKREWELYGKTLPDADLGQALALREPQLRQAEARIESARSVVRQAELDLRRTTISAPFRALVLEESVDIGQQVSPGSPMAALAGAEAFWIQATLPAAQLEAVLAAAAQGEAAARIYLPIEGMPSGEPILGVLVRHLGTVDPKGHMAQVLLEVKDPLSLDPGNPHQRLSLNTYVRAELDAGIQDQAAAIPRRSLRENNEIWVADADNKLQIRTADILWRQGETLAVTDVFLPGDRLVVSAVTDLLPDTEVRTGGALSSDEPATPRDAS